MTPRKPPPLTATLCVRPASPDERKRLRTEVETDWHRREQQARCRQLETDDDEQESDEDDDDAAECIVKVRAAGPWRHRAACWHELYRGADGDPRLRVGFSGMF